MSQSSRLEKKKQKKLTQADQVDRHELYQKSVQDTETEISLMVDKFQALRGREPVHFREDFCGTGLLSVDWCRGHPERTAHGVDLCKSTLQWGIKHNVQPAGEQIASRVNLQYGNVLDKYEPEVDLTCALNFSYSVFKTREQLRQYFSAAHAGLNKDGVLMLDLFGGTTAIDTLREKRRVEGENFKFIWQQKKYNPITSEILCHIHFRFDDGSKIKKAFTYDWRLWSIAELSELLKEAGFSRVHVYWEEYADADDDDDYLTGTGRYTEVTEVENQEAWVSYIFAEV